jgi:hypothetical protein
VNGALSYLPGQKLSRCTCPGEDHPGPKHSDGTYVGRSAPEIDVFEAQVSGEPPAGGVSQSAQWAVSVVVLDPRVLVWLTIAPFSHSMPLTPGLTLPITSSSRIIRERPSILTLEVPFSRLRLVSQAQVSQVKLHKIFDMLMFSRSSML